MQSFELTLLRGLGLKMRVNRKAVTRKSRKAGGLRVTQDTIVESLAKFLNIDLARTRTGKDHQVIQHELRTDILRLMDGAPAESLWEVLIKIVEKIEAMKITSILGVAPREREVRKAFLD